MRKLRRQLMVMCRAHLQLGADLGMTPHPFVARVELPGQQGLAAFESDFGASAASETSAKR